MYLYVMWYITIHLVLFTNLLICLLFDFVYSYLTGNKLDCFGVAFAVVASCQLLEVPGNHQTHPAEINIASDLHSIGTIRVRG